LLGAADDSAELAIDPGHFFAAEALAVQDRDLLLGPIDRIMDQVELDFQLLALLDLGTIAFQKRLGFRNHRGKIGFSLRGCAGRGSRHLAADRSQFAHDLAVHGTGIIVSNDGHWHVANNGFFDSITSAMNRHEKLSWTTPAFL